MRGVFILTSDSCLLASDFRLLVTRHGPPVLSNQFSVFSYCLLASDFWLLISIACHSALTTTHWS